MGNDVHSIGYNAFAECDSLTDVRFSPELKSIDGNAFDGCTSLETIELPSKVTVINGGAFRRCPIQSIKLSDSVKKIGFQAFGETKVLSIVIPVGVNEVGWLGIPNLESLSVEEGNLYFDSRDNCNAIINTSNNTLVMGCKNTVIPTSVESIDRFAFSGSSIEQITIPETVLSIGNYAFDNCANLKTITFEGSKIEGEFNFSSCI
jgi:hypothetical protein